MQARENTGYCRAHLELIRKMYPGECGYKVCDAGPEFFPTLFVMKRNIFFFRMLSERKALILRSHPVRFLLSFGLTMCQSQV